MKLVLARRPETCALAERLLRDRLQWRHYHAADRHPQQGGTSSLTLLAVDERGEAQGTLSLRDATEGVSSNGISMAPAPSSARSDVPIFVKITQLAVRSDPMGVPILAALFHASVVYARCRSASCCLLEVQTPDASFYRQVFGFTPMDDPLARPQPPHAQTTLMGLRLAVANEVRRKHGPRAMNASGELALRFFNARAERILFDRLVAHVSSADD